MTEMTDVSQFFAAVVAGDTDTVRRALDADPTLIRQTAPDGASATLTALYSGHASLADELAARSGELSVFEAAAFDDTGRLGDLIKADPAIVADWSADGWQPLHLAAFFGRTEAVRALLDADAPVAEASRNAMAVHPLHAAAAGQHGEIVWLLIASDAPVDATQRGGWTPLHSAANNSDLDSIRALLSAGADPLQPNEDGKTPLDLAKNDEVRAALTATD